MADTTKEVKTVLSLDAKEFIQVAGDAYEAIKKLAEKDFVGLIKNLGKVGAEIAVAGAIFYGLKKTMDAVFDGEEIRAINQQFDILTKNVGIAGEAMRGDLVKSAGGLAEDTEIIQAANKAVVELGNGAKRLPEIMELARKATSVMGGDLIQNFQGISQAIATGNMRMLKNLGIVVDQEKAIRKFADAHHVAASALSQAGKQQALMNEVLEKGNKDLAGIDPNVKEATNGWKQLKVALSEIGEIITLLVERTIGPYMRKGIGLLKNSVTELKTWLTAELGTGAEAAAANVKVLEDRVASLNALLAEQEKRKAAGFYVDPQIQIYKAELSNVEKQLISAKAAKDKFNEPAGGGGESPEVQQSIVDQEKLKVQKAKFEKEMLQLAKERRDGEMKLAESVAEVDALHARQKEELLKNEKQAIDELNAKRAMGDLTQEQMDQQVIQIHAITATRIKELDQNVLQERLRALDVYEKNAKSTADGIARGFVAGAQRARLSMQDFGKRGADTFQSFQKNASSAFQQVGSSGMSVGKALRQMFLNVIADRAQSEGELLLASGLWPPNPVALGAGAALIALAGRLRALSGGGAASGGGGGGGGGAAASAASTTSARVEDAKQSETKKTVTVQLHGDYLETDQTRMRMLEMIRSATDATDFKYVQVGKT